MAARSARGRRIDSRVIESNGFRTSNALARRKAPVTAASSADDATSLEAWEAGAALLAINLRGCRHTDLHRFCDGVYRHVLAVAGKLPEACDRVSAQLGVRIRRRHLAVSSLGPLTEQFFGDDFVHLARTLDGACAHVRADAVTGFSTNLVYATGDNDFRLVDALPQALARAERVCSRITLGDGLGRLNLMAADRVMARLTKSTTEPGNPWAARVSFAAGAARITPWILSSELPAECGELSLAVAARPLGAIVRRVRAALARTPDLDLSALGVVIQSVVHQAVRVAEVAGRKLAAAVNAEFVGADASLVPARRPDHSVVELLRLLGLEQFGAEGTASALHWLKARLETGAAMAGARLCATPRIVLSPGFDLSLHHLMQAGKVNADRLLAPALQGSAIVDGICVSPKTDRAALVAALADQFTAFPGPQRSFRLIPVAGKRSGEVASLGNLGGEAVVCSLAGGDLSNGFIRRMSAR